MCLTERIHTVAPNTIMYSAKRRLGYNGRSFRYAPAHFKRILCSILMNVNKTTLEMLVLRLKQQYQILLKPPTIVLFALGHRNIDKLSPLSHTCSEAHHFTLYKSPFSAI